MCCIIKNIEENSFLCFYDSKRNLLINSLQDLSTTLTLKIAVNDWNIERL